MCGPIDAETTGYSIGMIMRDFMSKRLLLLLLAAAGCAASPRDCPQPPLGSEAFLDASGSVTAAGLLPHRPAKAAFVYVRGRRAPRRVGYRVEAIGQQGSEQVMQVVIQSVSESRLLWDKDGVSVESERDLEQQVLVQYAPSLLILPARMDMGQVCSGQVQMTVRNLADDSVRARGTCSYTIELMGRQKVITPAGQFKATVLKLMRQINLPLVQMQVTIYDAYVPQRGKIAQRVVQTGRAVGLIPMDRDDEMRLSSPGSPGLPLIGGLSPPLETGDNR